MRRFLLKKGVTFLEGDNRWRVLNRLPDGRIQLESQVAEIQRVDEMEIWGRHESGVWQVDRDSIAETGASPIAVLRRDASTFKDDDVRLATMRLSYIREVLANRCIGRRHTEDVLAQVAGRFDGQPPSYRTFCRWVKRYAVGNDLTDLIPRNEGKGRNSTVAGPLLDVLEDVVETHYLNSQRPTISLLYDHLVDEIERQNECRSVPLPLISRATLHRYVQTLDRYVLATTREGREVARKRYRPTYGVFKTTRINERWEIDHTPVDVLCVCPIRRIVIFRPILTVIIDRHSRMVMGFHIGARVPGQQELAIAIRMAMFGKGALLDKLGIHNMEWLSRGIPELIVTDNGAEFHGNGLRLGCADLGIVLCFCPGRAPWHKGAVERFMRTISEQLFHRIPGTTWSNILQRGEYDSQEMACVTLDDLTKLTLCWIVERYQHSPHRGLRGKTPHMVWEECCRTQLIQMPEDPSAVEVAFSALEQRPITNRGVTLDHLSYNCPALQQLRFRIPEGEKLHVRYFGGRVDRVEILDPINKQYIGVPCIDRDYAVDLTRDMHRMLVDQLNEEKKVIDTEGLRKARIGLGKMIDELYQSHRLSSRKKAARAEGQSSRSLLDQDLLASSVGTGNRGSQESLPQDVADQNFEIPTFSVSKRK